MNKLFFLIFSVLVFFRSAEAKVYLDITSPQRQLAIAVHELSGPNGKELSDIVGEDLSYTGFFVSLDRNAFIEEPAGNFTARNWTVIGAEAVVKGQTTEEEDGRITALIHLYDVFESKTIMSKKYASDKSGLRLLAHTIANDIYKELTGEQGVFTTALAFVTAGDNVQELHLMDWDGERRRSLGISGSVILRPHWSGEGGMLLYSAQRKRQWGIFILDFKKMKERLVYSSGKTDIAGDFMPGSNEFALSSTKDGTPDIYVFNIEQSRLTPLVADKGIEVSPAVSPDGEKIAFVSDRGGSPQLYITDRSGYTKDRITFEGSYNTSPSWSPKGGLLVFSGRYEGKNQIFTVRPDGSELKLLTERGNNEDPTYSPDGRFIAFTSDRDGVKGIYIMRVDGEAQRRLTPAGVKAFGSAWSPK